jgi:hypothetical protein
MYSTVPYWDMRLTRLVRVMVGMSLGGDASQDLMPCVGSYIRLKLRQWGEFGGGLELGG